MLKRLLILTAATLVLAGIGGSAVQAQKKGSKPAPTPSPWTCQVTLRDADGDLIKSDNMGPYVHGQNGVNCTINAEPTAAHYGWLYLYFPNPRKSTRSIRYLGLAQDADGGAGYNGFDSKGTFEVKDMVEGWSGAQLDLRPFRAVVEIGQFLGTSANSPGDSTSSVFVVPQLDGCSWDFWFDPAAEPFTSPTGSGDDGDTRFDPRVLALGDLKAVKGGNLVFVTKGLYAMPFGATVTITGGGPVGTPCPPPY